MTSSIEKIFQFSLEEKLKFKSLGIQAVILFGSQALGLARENSDFDIAILVKQPSVLFAKDYHQYVEIYNSLYDIFSSHINGLVNIDIVFLQKAPAELRAHVAKHGLVLYQSEAKIFADFREEVMNQYSDFEPVREMFHSSILARIQ